MGARRIVRPELALDFNFQLGAGGAGNRACRALRDLYGRPLLVCARRRRPHRSRAAPRRVVGWSRRCLVSPGDLGLARRPRAVLAVAILALPVYGVVEQRPPVGGWARENRAVWLLLPRSRAIGRAAGGPSSSPNTSSNARVLVVREQNVWWLRCIAPTWSTAGMGGAAFAARGGWPRVPDRERLFFPKPSSTARSRDHPSSSDATTGGGGRTGGRDVAAGLAAYGRTARRRSGRGRFGLGLSPKVLGSMATFTCRRRNETIFGGPPAPKPGCVAFPRLWLWAGRAVTRTFYVRVLPAGSDLANRHSHGPARLRGHRRELRPARCGGGARSVAEFLAPQWAQFSSFGTGAAKLRSTAVGGKPLQRALKTS